MKTLVDSVVSIRFALCLVVLALMMPFAGHSAGYVKFDEIDGEAIAAGYEGWSDVDTLAQVISREVDPETGLKPAKLEDIICSKVLDKASPKLANAVAAGLTFPIVEIHLTRNAVTGGQAPYLKYELEDVAIVSYNLFGSSNPLVINRESLSLNFRKIKMTYIEYDLDGNEADTVEFTWDKLTGTN